MNDPESPELPPELAAEREAVEAEIYAAFANVTLGKGVSWGETAVLDGYGTLEEQRKARRGFPKNAWELLVDDPNWTSEGGMGYWAYLDARGLRYYLPAGMVRLIRGEHESEVLFALTPHYPSELPYRLEKWSALDDRQRRCIKRFLLFLIAWGEYESIQARTEPWEAYYMHDSPLTTQCREALAAYWDRIPEEGLP